MPDFCRSCKAKVVWALTEKGKRMPVDAEPAVGGTIVLEHTQQGKPPLARVVSGEELSTMRRQEESRGEELRLFKSHFATCPDRGKWRKKERKAKGMNGK